MGGVSGGLVDILLMQNNNENIMILKLHVIVKSAVSVTKKSY